MADRAQTRLVEDSLSADELAAITQRFGDRRCWGVVSTFAVDSHYGGLTYTEAREVAQRDSQEPGRDACVVLEVERWQGPSLLSSSTGSHGSNPSKGGNKDAE